MVCSIGRPEARSRSLEGWPRQGDATREEQFPADCASLERRQRRSHRVAGMLVNLAGMARWKGERTEI